MKPLTRRTFLHRSAVALGSATLGAPQILAKSVTGANDKLNLAWVGIGKRGWGDLRNCAHENNVVAICDPDPATWPPAKELFPQARFYKDFRRMFDGMEKQIDAVGIGTPDHTHFPATYAALLRDKHVFVQKPLAHSLWEVQTLRRLAAEKNLVTQMGNQGHASEGARLVKEWVEAGLVGDVAEIIAWTNRPAKGWGFGGPVQTAFPEAQPVPDGMDWDAWLGPVTKPIGFNEAFHPIRWRGWWDFGCGGLGDIGCHTIDTPFWAMNLGMPERVEVELGGEANPIFTPYGSIVTFHFPARAARPPVELTWVEGPSRPTVPPEYDWDVKAGGGLIMIGEKGGICHDGMRPDSPRLYPQSDWQAYRTDKDGRVPKTLPRTKGIENDWLNAIKSGTKACSDFSYAAPLTQVILLGTLVIRTGKGLVWDAENETIRDNPEAAALMKIGARNQWDIGNL